MKAAGVRTYIPEKKQAGRRHWVGKQERQQVVYQNRQRLQRPKGKQLLWGTDRADLRALLRNRRHAADALEKTQQYSQAAPDPLAGVNLGLLLRTLYGVGTPRSLQGLSLTLHFLVVMMACAIYSENVADPRSKSNPPKDGIALLSSRSFADFSDSESQNSIFTPDC